MFYLFGALVELWKADSRPEARQLTLGCGLVAVIGAVMLLAAKAWLFGQ